MTRLRDNLMQPKHWLLRSIVGHYGRFAVVLLIAQICVLCTKPAVGQIPRDHHQPLSQHVPPGAAAAWLNAIRQYDQSWMQPILIEAPGGGQVEIFSGSSQSRGAAVCPALIAINAGHTYRFRISEIPGMPGVEVFPSVELLDRLHPPTGRENDFPIPIVLTEADIRTAMTGQLVTRVIYLEQPQIAQAMDPLRRPLPQSVPPTDNILERADRLGRPMAIIRVGGRRPSANSPPGFYGTGGAFQMRQVQPEPAGSAATVHMNSHPAVQQISATGQRRR